MNRRYGTPETSVQVRRIDKNGEEHDNQDVAAGIAFVGDGVLQIDLRNLRPIRILDRECLLVEVYLHDVLAALADKLEEAVKE